MAKSTSVRQSERAEPVEAKRPNVDPATDALIERLRSARSINEMSRIVGLKPITGRSAPKIAY